ncbi:MAG: monofunctional biosynthetic peptidoglycan transglycosylase [Thermodesulfovibrionales bacterium]|nr:monofunctional biosynthetic peptidoglycan transglycosylase [Thermodesulfovibrionales bacterium]
MARRKRKKGSFKKICWIFAIFVISGISAYLYFSFPDIESLKRHNPKKTSFMEYREREWKRQGRKYRILQKWVSLSQVSPYLIKAVLIAEDDKFWSHEGFDYEAMQKAMGKDIKAGKFKAGGSTISQQLAKNLYLSPSKNPMRKIEEAVITWRMEKVLSKKRILELYLNVAEWGDVGIFGIEAAAGHYYGKSASSLTAEESARLASVLPNPRRYNLLGDSKYVVNRSNLIYNIMIKRGIVVPQYEEVLENRGKDTASPNLSETRQTPAQ